MTTDPTDRPSCPDPIECQHEAALGQAEMRLETVHDTATAWARPSMSEPSRIAGRHLLSILDGDPGAVAGPAPATDRAEVRDRLRYALAREVRKDHDSSWDGCLEDDEFGSWADAVLAVLPAPVDRNFAETRKVSAPLPAPVDPAVVRATALREAADAVRDGDLGPRGGMSRDYENGWWNSRAAAEDRVRRLTDKPQPVTASDARHLLTRMRADAASTTLTDLLRLLAVWAASSEGRDVLIDDLITAGYRLPHACGNCEGIDPGTRLANPHRTAPAAVAQPDEEG